MKQHHLLSASLVALSVVIAGPALAQMKTSNPKPAATPSVTPAPMRTTDRVVEQEERAPIGLKVFGAYDFMGSVSNGGFVPATTQAPGVTAPALAQASPSVGASGYAFGAEYELPVIAVGAKYQAFGFGSPITAAINNPPTGVTQTTAPNFDVFLPQNYWELYGKLGPLKVGYRNENYAGTGFGGSYGNLMGGLQFGFGIDPISLNFGAMGGYNLSKPSTLPANVTHMPVEGDVNLAVDFGLLKAKVGYKALAVANADAATLMTALTNPASLAAPGGATQAQLDALYATRFGLYTGPYLGLAVGF